METYKMKEEDTGSFVGTSLNNSRIALAAEEASNYQPRSLLESDSASILERAANVLHGLACTVAHGSCRTCDAVKLLREEAQRLREAEGKKE
jgi:hypothetical protein